MNINRLHPSPSTFWDEVDQLLNRALSPSARSAGSGRLLVNESEDGWVLQTDLPGFSREDVSVSVENGVLSVTATAPEDRPAFAGGFEQKVRLSDKVDPTGISARLENGVLAVELPRKEANPAANIRIDVN